MLLMSSSSSTQTLARLFGITRFFALRPHSTIHYGVLTPDATCFPTCFGCRVSRSCTMSNAIDARMHQPLAMICQLAESHMSKTIGAAFSQGMWF